MSEVNKFLLKNKGGYVIKAGISYFGQDGIWHTPNIKNKYHSIGISQIINIDEYMIPEGTEVKLYVDILWGKKQNADEKFIYNKKCETFAYYEIKGTVLHGNKPKYVPMMEVFWVDTTAPRSNSPDCKMMSLSDVRKIYPNTLNLNSGYWTKHPIDELALTPIDDYFKILEINKAYECITLLGKMGASKIHIIMEDKQKVKNNTELKMSYKELGVTSNAELLNSLSEFKEFDVLFPSSNKNNMDRSDKEDMELLKKSQWFKDDAEMKSIFELLLSNNMPKTFRVTSNIKQTFGFNFNLAAQYLKTSVAEIKNQYKMIKNTCRIFEVEFNNIDYK
jgi:hypothetical protein